ncbi:MAG TPA: ABC transporter permease [Sphingomonas sp.]|nr:ABC transporter permease [Sphingomonas sp.]
MWRNYLTVGLRTLVKNRTYAFINIFGLALGIAACLLMLLYVRYEANYDGWMPHADQAYQLQMFYRPDKNGGQAKDLQVTPIIAAQELARDFPQVEKTVFVRSFSPIVIQDGRPSKVDDLRMVDGNLFDILQVPFVEGDPRTALSDTHSLAISQSEARKRFGNADPIGKTLTIVDNAGDVDYRITGVFKDFPRDSSFSASMVARFDLAVQFADRARLLTDWNSEQGWNYVKLNPGTDVAAINAALPAWEEQTIPDQVINGEKTNAGDIEDFKLVNIRDVHLGKAQEYGVTPGNDAGTVATFAVIALLVLGMACVNFTNLATARASQRAREVALRKVLGARRGQLIVQFLSESILIAAITTLIALALVELALPGFNAFLGAGIELHYFGADGIWLPCLVLILLVGVAGGLYPAFYLSRFQPARILKANRSSTDAQGSGRLRNALVVAQFAVSIGLIVCTSVIYAQTRYAQTMDAGFRRDGLLQVANLDFKGVSDSQARSVIERIRRLPGVVAAAGTQIAVSPNGNSSSSYFLPGATNSVTLGTYGVSDEFFEAMGMRLLAGRFFSPAFAKDDATTPYPPQLDAERALAARGVNVVISELAAQRLGFRTPQDAIGKTIGGNISLPEVGLVPCTIVGVVSDARFRSLHEPQQPIVYVMQKVGYGQIAVRFANVAPAAVRAEVGKVWQQLVPEVPFTADFANELVREQYDRDVARGELFAAFAVLAVVIGCLGLFGLAAFTAERRTKEIGIRKVLGAKTRDIVRLLVWQFSRPVLIANVIAWPAAWWIMRTWLNGFDQRIGLGPLPFVAAGGLALAIAVATIAAHAWQVARTRPVKALRYE